MPVRRPLFSRFSPPQLIALSFAVAILLGALLLWSPLAHESGKAISFVDALFMATSALCVTGLAVTDPGSTFSLFGELTMLLLIQVGGLGIITFGVLFALLQRRRVGVTERLQLAQQVNAVSGDVAGVVPFIRNIFLFTFLIEGLGALLLACRFVPQFGLEHGAYLAFFHAVSAFNNAGFSLFPNNIMDYAGDALVSLTLSALFILGGMGVLAQLNLLAHWRSPRQQRLMVHTRMVVLVMSLLILVGFLGVLLLEWNNPATLGPLSVEGKLVAAFFQGTTPRTAGFNSLDYGAMTLPTIFLTIWLMFIGANPGSTGGGIKTSTFFVMMASAWSMVRGYREMVMFGRRIPQETVLRAMTVGLLSLGIVNLGIMALTLTNTNSDVLFVQLMFEAVSAFATTGLSMNATGLLNDTQELILIALMYLGRIGPLTFAVAFTARKAPEPVRYPEEPDILIG